MHHAVVGTEGLQPRTSSVAPRMPSAHDHALVFRNVPEVCDIAQSRSGSPLCPSAGGQVGMPQIVKIWGIRWRGRARGVRRKAFGSKVAIIAAILSVSAGGCGERARALRQAQRYPTENPRYSQGAYRDNVTRCQTAPQQFGGVPRPRQPQERQAHVSLVGRPKYRQRRFGTQAAAGVPARRMGRAWILE